MSTNIKLQQEFQFSVSDVASCSYISLYVGLPTWVEPRQVSWVPGLLYQVVDLPWYREQRHAVLQSL